MDLIDAMAEKYTHLSEETRPEGLDVHTGRLDQGIELVLLKHRSRTHQLMLSFGCCAILQ